MQSDLDNVYITPFPFFDSTEERKKEIPFAREYAFDFETGQFKKDLDNKMYIVEGEEAVKIWIWKVLMTTRYKNNIFPNYMGQEVDTLIGKGYTPGYINSEAKRFYTEALERNLNDYIENIEELTVDFDDGTLIISSVIKTIYGSINLDNLEVWGW